ncbi:MAG TPA: hypothetical protein VFU59_10665, partial [Candidatus Eisenbacteria bacterium]|nr:hypothetical protein [Candidatus Eisenbacteria bacterium]
MSRAGVTDVVSAKVGTGAAPDDAILDELVDMARRHPERQLLQFRSRIGANQYRRLYRLVREFTAEGAAVLDWGSGNG